VFECPEKQRVVGVSGAVHRDVACKVARKVDWTTRCTIIGKFRFGDCRPTSFSVSAFRHFKLLRFLLGSRRQFIVSFCCHIFQAHAIVGFGSDSWAPFRWFPLKHNPRDSQEINHEGEQRFDGEHRER
jgi:hypothetical protein